MKARHYIIPIFIPMQGCPYQCIYCDQRSIAGQSSIPDTVTIHKTVTQYLSTISNKNARVEVGFFGGTFTALSEQLQADYLGSVQSFIDSGAIDGIRLSTRPDCICFENLKLLGNFKVTTIELGVQSMDDEVLKKSGRGYTSEQVRKAARAIKDFGFRLGLQMMIGLPGDTEEKCLETARQFIQLQVDDVRIYPTLVIRHTPLEKLFIQGNYQPLTLSEAIRITASVLLLFEQHHINVIRVGLHPSEGLLNGRILRAGPWHPAFKELVLTHIWRGILQKAILASLPQQTIIRITVPESELRYVVGYRRQNINYLKTLFKKVMIIPSAELPFRTCYVDYC